MAGLVTGFVVNRDFLDARYFNSKPFRESCHTNSDNLVDQAFYDSRFIAWPYCLDTHQIEASGSRREDEDTCARPKDDIERRYWRPASHSIPRLAAFEVNTITRVVGVVLPKFALLGPANPGC